MLMTAAATSVPTARTPLLDGRCESAEWQTSKLLGANSGYSLRGMQDRDFLYLCFAYPETSLGMVDLYLTTPKQKVPVNLHASAKLGERLRSASGWPEYSWWNARGWSTQLIGFETVVDGKPTFHGTPQKEFQLSLTRFGTGKWRLMAEALDSANGSIAARLPLGGDKDNAATFLKFEVR